MSLISLLSFGLIKPSKPLWELVDVVYVGTSPTKLSHIYRALLIRGKETKEVDYSFRTTKKLDKVRQYVLTEVDKLNGL